MSPILFQACTICGYHSPEETSNAAAWSILFLLVVILAVLGGVVFFLTRMIRRDRETLDPSLCDDYVPGRQP